MSPGRSPDRLTRYPPRRSTRLRRNIWFERVLAIAAVTNLGFVLFDLSYVPLRDFWLQGRFQIPLLNLPVQVPMAGQITQLYDPIKGIEPHRDTQRYLEAVEQLEQAALQNGINSPTVEPLLADLRSLSHELVTNNPFQTANKSGTLEKIKNRMRDRLYNNPREGSAHQAFDTFWSREYLSRSDQALSWFNQKIKPLIATNYYRTIGESGDFTNNFGLIDAPFATLFFLEFLARTFYLSRRYTALPWRDAMLMRWYDALLFIPFWLSFPVLGLLRALPVAVRLHQANLVNMHHVRDRATQLFVNSIAEEITEAVVIQVLDQTQMALRRGDLTRLLGQALTTPRVQVNDTDEVAAISTLLVKLTVYQVLPKIQPELEHLLTHSIDTVLKQSPAYSSLRSLPGLGDVPNQINQRIVKEVIAALYQTVTTMVDDPHSTELTSQLVQKLGSTFTSELQEQQVLQEIQALVNDLLEEVKLTFAQRSSAIDAATLLEETQQLRQIARR
jgi:hypothetical protein